MLHQITLTIETVIPGSDELYLAVRAAFTARGTSLNAWCKTEGINRQTVEKALRGQRHSRKAIALRQRLVSELFPEKAAWAS